MRQLTSLDAQFLALETPRQSGHVGARIRMASGNSGFRFPKAVMRKGTVR